MTSDDLRETIARLRQEWRDVRCAAENRKKAILSITDGKRPERRDKEWRLLRKRMKSIAVRLRHLERKLNRKSAHEKKK